MMMCDQVRYIFKIKKQNFNKYVKKLFSTTWYSFCWYQWDFAIFKFGGVLEDEVQLTISCSWVMRNGPRTIGGWPQMATSRDEGWSTGSHCATGFGEVAQSVGQCGSPWLSLWQLGSAAAATGMMPSLAGLACVLLLPQCGLGWLLQLWGCLCAVVAGLVPHHRCVTQA